MTAEEQSLWKKVNDFRIDEEGIDFSFSQRLARENGWTDSYAVRVINEYKKFLFLCCISETGVTPPDPVDQAWHLHLAYTKSYWINLCKNTLGKEIHHNPTKGGKKEGKKFDSFYTNTHQLYQEKFGEAPPADIWQDNHSRFTNINFQRINLGQYWLIRKPSQWFRKFIVIVAICLFAAISIQASVGLFPLILFVVFLVIVIIASRQKGKGGNNNSGCSTSGCTYDSGHGGHGGHGGSGCSSGCSGCSGSGCSGCSGGGGD